MQRFGLNKDAGKMVKKASGKWVRAADAQELVADLSRRIDLMGKQLFERQAALERMNVQLHGTMRTCQAMHHAAADLAGTIAGELKRMNDQKVV